MSAADEQAREVEVLARALLRMLVPDREWEELDANRREPYERHARRVLAAFEPIRAAERQEAAREAVGALELTEQVAVNWCEFEGWWDPYRDGSGSWEKCKLPADHTKPHEGVDGGSWPRDLQDPEDQPKPRRRRLVGPWQDVPSADGVTGRSEG